MVGVCHIWICLLYTSRRNLAVARSQEVSPEERRHAQRALSIMMNVQWKSNYFESIDPKEARRILDEELYGMERVKQRIIETLSLIHILVLLQKAKMNPILVMVLAGVMKVLSALAIGV